MNNYLYNIPENWYNFNNELDNNYQGFNNKFINNQNNLESPIIGFEKGNLFKNLYDNQSNEIVRSMDISVDEYEKKFKVRGQEELKFLFEELQNFNNLQKNFQQVFNRHLSTYLRG